jgi:eukaryotic-like serine/threonine-protein kinase
MSAPEQDDTSAAIAKPTVGRTVLQKISIASGGALSESFKPDSQAPLQESSLRVTRILSRVFLVLALLTASVVIVGWIFSVEALKHLLYGQITGFPTVFWLALVTLFATPSVLDLNNRPLRWICRLGLVCTFAVGLTLWLEHILGVDWNLNQIIYQPQVSDDSAAPLTLPGATPVDISFCLILSSLSALSLDLLGKRLPLLFQILSATLALPSFFLVLACLFGVGDAVDVFCAYQGCVRFKYLNYTILFFLQSALFLSRPALGITQLLVVDSMGGRQVKLAIVGALLMVPLAWLLVFAMRREIINAPTAIILTLIGLVIIVGVLVAYGARKIDRVEKDRQASVQSLSEMSERQSTTFTYKKVCLQCGREFADEFEACPYDSSSLTRVLDRLAPGSVFADKYEIGEALGSGGMSTVYRAQHLFLDKVVAIKLLNQQLASDASAVQRFQVEAKAAYELDHPNLLGVYDFGLSTDGQAYIVMDYLEGESLADIIKREGTVDLARALPIFLDICSGLAHAHDKGVLHRDIKPSNVMLVIGARGKLTAKIVDFGLAKVYDDSALKLTQTGEIFGSPLYMSPEQCRGLPLDFRSDLYSLGVLMYETLSGRVPIMGTSVYDTFAKKLSEAPQPLEADLLIPDWLDRLIFCLLRCDPCERPATAHVLSSAIKQYVRG